MGGTHAMKRERLGETGRLIEEEGFEAGGISAVAEKCC
jgi:hypothetical protein